MSEIGITHGTAAVLFLVVRVGLVDFAGLPEKVRTRAESMVQYIYQRAGIEVDFVETSGKPDLWLQVLKEPPHRLERDVTGFAVLVASQKYGDSYAAVSYPTVLEAARNLNANSTDLLAASMAHEIGHVLLHSDAHSRTGVMSPRFGHREMWLLGRGELLFTAGQASRMLNRIQFAP